MAMPASPLNSGLSNGRFRDILDDCYCPKAATLVGARLAGDALGMAVARKARSYRGNSACGRLQLSRWR